MERESNITIERLDKYFEVTGKALEKVKLAEAEYVKLHFKKAADDFLDMAKRYYEDARHFQEQGRIVDAFACLNYAHGWLDAGARLHLFDVGGDNQLFTIDKESEDQHKAEEEEFPDHDDDLE